MNQAAIFGLAVAGVVGVVCGLTVLFDPKDAHDICLAGISGLVGAVTGAGAHAVIAAANSQNPQ